MTVFFVRRHSNNEFMPNAYVFPGGKLDPEDSDASSAALCRGRTAEEAGELLGDVPPEVALALHVAAARETFEEVGVFLGNHADGRPLNLEDAGTHARFEVHRESLHAGEKTLSQICDEENLVLELGELFYWDHWVTPEIERRRFDARFFLTVIPEGQEPIHDSRETTDSGWFSPREALECYEAGSLPLAPPTYRVLIDLDEIGDIDAVLAVARTRRCIPPVLPVAHLVDGGLALLLPGDGEYPDAGAEDTGVHRAVLEDGRWVLQRG
jgi:8-oxo-dGTP pyrophosphatase MutT (NUDIX family)